MKWLGPLRKMAAVFRRDLCVARSYRASFLLEMLEALFAVASFYYLSRFVQTDELARALPQGGNYFAFALVGFAFFDYLAASVDAFENSLAEAQQNRTLESLLVTETPLPVILAGSAVYPFALMALRTGVYLAWGVFLFRFPVYSANWLGALLLLLASIVAFAGLGVLSASYLLLFKRGNPAKWFFLGISGLVGGMLYPVSVLPQSLQLVARLIPLTYSLEGMRAALLGGAPLAQLWPSLRALLLFAAILLPVSLAVFAWALRRTKITGTLAHF
jgi:ABC-2 type transport system permease protein